MHIRDTNALSALLLLGIDAADAAALKATDLPLRGFSALVLVRNRPSCTVNWLHRRLALTQSGAVRLVDRLEGLGLVGREKSSGRREVALSVTHAGETRLRKGLNARLNAMQELVEPLSEAEQRQLAALVGKMLAVGDRTQDETDAACRLCDWDVCKPTCPLDASVDPVIVGDADGDGAGFSAQSQA